MENATKALLIAAAVLVAIIIISLTLSIVQQGSDAVSDADLSEAEMTQFNSKFTAYEGRSISTSQANTLLNTVLSHNVQEKNTKNGRYVKVTGAATLNTNATSVTPVTGTSYYSVTLTKTNGLVTEVKLTKNP